MRGIGFDPGRPNGPAETLRLEARDVATAIHTGAANTDDMLVTLDGLRIGRASADGGVDGVAPFPSLGELPPNVEQVGLGKTHLHLDGRLFTAVYVLPTAMGLLPQATRRPRPRQPCGCSPPRVAAEVRTCSRRPRRRVRRQAP